MKCNLTATWGERGDVFVYDVAIVGAGPAGSTLARLVGNKYNVLLVDKRVITSSIDGRRFRKCCGGLLAPDAQKMLSQMGLGLPKSVAKEPITEEREVLLYLSSSSEKDNYEIRHSKPGDIQTRTVGNPLGQQLGSGITN